MQGHRPPAWLLASLSVALTACGTVAPAPQDAALQAQITFGQRDGGEHPYVGTLLFAQNGEGYFSCTGTLLTPTVMLTAGHCVEGGGQANDETWVRFDEDAAGDYFSPTSAWLTAKWIRATRVIPHPLFDDYSAFPDTYDVGLVILSQPVNMGTYGQLPPLGYFDTTPQEQLKAQLFEPVGYGLLGKAPPTSNKPIPDDYARYKGLQRFIEVNSTTTGSQSVKLTNNPGQGNGGGGTCNGDSGGPTLLNNTSVVAAVNSFSVTPNCKGTDFMFRMDTALAQNFVTPYLR